MGSVARTLFWPWHRHKHTGTDLTAVVLVSVADDSHFLRLSPRANGRSSTTGRVSRRRMNLAGGLPHDGYFSAFLMWNKAFVRRVRHLTVRGETRGLLGHAHLPSRKRTPHVRPSPHDAARFTVRTPPGAGRAIAEVRARSATKTCPVTSADLPEARNSMTSVSSSSR